MTYILSSSAGRFLLHMIALSIIGMTVCFVLWWLRRGKEEEQDREKERARIRKMDADPEDAQIDDDVVYIWRKKEVL